MGANQPLTQADVNKDTQDQRHPAAQRSSPALPPAPSKACKYLDLQLAFIFDSVNWHADTWLNIVLHLAESARIAPTFHMGASVEDRASFHLRNHSTPLSQTGGATSTFKIDPSSIKYYLALRLKHSRETMSAVKQKNWGNLWQVSYKVCVCGVHVFSSSVWTWEAEMICSNKETIKTKHESNMTALNQKPFSFLFLIFYIPLKTLQKLHHTNARPLEEWSRASKHGRNHFFFEMASTKTLLLKGKKKHPKSYLPWSNSVHCCG